jgi:hypothetical protein
MLPRPGQWLSSSPLTGLNSRAYASPECGFRRGSEVVLVSGHLENTLDEETDAVLDALAVSKGGQLAWSRQRTRLYAWRRWIGLRAGGRRFDVPACGPAGQHGLRELPRNEDQSRNHDNSMEVPGA